MFYRQSTGLMRRIRFSHHTNIAVATCTTSSIPKTSNTSISMWNKNPRGMALWILLSSPAAVFLGTKGTLAFAEDDTEAAAFRKIEDGSIVSNIHTSKWRVFTDNGRNLSQQGKLDEAERYFLLALQEAKQGFGEKDPHVASSCNNLAELYRVKKAFGEAEPFYLEAVKILEETYGPDDVRVGAACHNLGQFYLVQRKLEEAQIYYERALKIKRRVLGHNHPDYADTMYHLGTVMHLVGKDKDSETLIPDSIKILEEGGQGESMTCLRRLRYLSQIHINSSRLTEAENIQRKILHILEVSKGWNSLDTVIAAERLALTLQSIGTLKEAKELLQQCLDVRKNILHANHIQIGANMLHIARVAILNSNQLRKVDFLESRRELEEAKVLLDNSITITRKYLDDPKQKRNNLKDEQAALVILLQSFTALGRLEISKQELQEPREARSRIPEAETAFHQCISVFKEGIQSGTWRLVSISPDVKADYLSCLKHLLSLIGEHTDDRTENSKKSTLQELKDEIMSVESDLSQNKKS